MKRILIPALAAAALTAAVTPALAQPIRGDIDAREANIAQRIDEGARTHQLNRRGAFRLRGELRGIQDLEARYRHNGPGYRSGPGGLSPGERQDLLQRLDSLSRQVFVQRH